MLSTSIKAELQKISAKIIQEKLNREWVTFQKEVETQLRLVAAIGETTAKFEFEHAENCKRAVALFEQTGLNAAQHKTQKGGDIIYVRW